MRFSDSSSLCDYLRSQADTEKAAFDQKLIPGSSHEFLGWAVPELRKLAKELAHKEPQQALALTASSQIHEMILLHGFVIGYARWSWEEWTQYVEDFVPRITDWAICDMVCCTLTLIRKHRAEGWDFLRPYWESGKEFEQRFAVIMLMDHYLTEEYLEKVLDVLRHLPPAGYYAAMAVGWAMQCAFLKKPELVFPLLTDPDIALESRVLARKKILESLRTPQEWRPRVKALKLS